MSPSLTNLIIAQLVTVVLVIIMLDLFWGRRK